MKNAVDQVALIEAIVNDLKRDALEFSNNGNVAESRLRKSSEALKTLAQDLRKGIQEKKRAERLAKKAKGLNSTY
ncbi:MAG: hypothetical protein ACLQQ4_16705 [Bacteroidia bacterium]